MNKIKDIFLDDSIDISNKLYIVFSAASVVIILGLFFINVITSAALYVTFITWGLIFIQSSMLTYAIYKRSFYLASLISCVLINYLAFPYVFLSGNLFFGSVPIWMMIGYAYSGMVLSKQTRTVFIVFQSIINIMCFIVSFGMDWTAVTNNYSYNFRLVDYWFAVFAGGILLFAMVSFSNWLNNFVEKTIVKQTQDIANLYKNQNRFFSSMSHEIRTPINTIIGLNEVNLSLNPKEDIMDYSTEIKFASKKLLALINDILDISKLQSGKMEVVETGYNLSDIISLITDEVWKESYDRGLKLNIIVDPNTPNELYGDEIRIIQIVRNILIRSINTTETGSVELQIRFEELEDNKINLIFEIVDTGMGIRRENLPYVFDIYRKNEEEKNGNEGTGLELPIAKSLSDVMGGNISVDSIYGRGNRYRFSVVQKLVAEGEATQTFENRENRKDYNSFCARDTRVLVVDDDGMNLNVFKKMFESVFPHIETATSGEEAIKLCEANKYDIVFIDHLMPGMNGIETLENIRKAREDVIAIALTANTGSDARALYKEAGFSDYLAKPIDKEYALRTIYKLLPDDKKENVIDGKDNEHTTRIFEEQKRATVVITTDSVSDIPDYLLEKYNIPLIPFYVNTSEGRRYRDREEISSNSLISFINNDDRFAFSEAPDESEYEIFFGRILRQADSIIHLSVARKNSEGYKNASAASKSFANVEVIDSGNVCFGLGMMAIDAAKLAADGASVSEIKEQIMRDKDDIKLDFVIDETRNLAATGRIPMIVHRICSFFNIHLIIKMRDSRMVVRSIRVGDINKIRERYFNSILEKNNISNEFFVLLHSDFDSETLERLKGKVQRKILAENVIVVSPGAAIASNCGRGAFGVCYRKK